MRQRLRRTIALAAVALALAAAAPALADALPVNDSGGYFEVPITNWKRLRQRSVLIQKYDFSCGSAALAALLTFNYHRPSTEEAVFQAMYRVGDQAQIRRVGFSLFDMKLYLESIGLRADGFRISLNDLARLKLPAIALIDVRGYKHFVVVKGIDERRVLIGDPARGLVALPRPDFAAQWNGTAFFIRDEPEAAQLTFNDEKVWSIEGRAPVTAAFNQQSLASLTLNLR